MAPADRPLLILPLRNNGTFFVFFSLFPFFDNLSGKEREEKSGGRCFFRRFLEGVYESEPRGCRGREKRRKEEDAKFLLFREINALRGQRGRGETRRVTKGGDRKTGTFT